MTELTERGWEMMIDAVFQRLQSSNLTADAVMEEFALKGEDEKKALVDLDEIAFRCDCCDFWCLRDEESPDLPGTCTDCDEEDDE